MDDANIVELYWRRSNDAIRETSAKYGSYCRIIAYNILQNHEDSEECVNDTYLRAWNSMPDNRPSSLAPYLGRICRNLALSRQQSKQRIKRGGGEIDLALDELSECIAIGSSTEQEFEHRELVGALNLFLSTLSPPERKLFVARYWYIASLDELAECYNLSKSKCSSMLHRTRKKLKKFLIEGDYI